MKRYIVTGAPGSGKTSVINALEKAGAHVVAEAATDIITELQMQGIAKPWENDNFIDCIIRLQKHRQLETSGADCSDLYFFDRSPICTYALAMYLQVKASTHLMQEIERITEYGVYHKNVFFIDNLGFIENTSARQINFEAALAFEKMHVEAYTKFGFNCIHIPAISIEKRAQIILKSVHHATPKSDADT